jgi:hypothetical protein
MWGKTRAAILFADGDEDERRVMWVNSVQVRSGKLTDPELEALGADRGQPGLRNDACVDIVRRQILSIQSAVRFR